MTDPTKDELLDMRISSIIRDAEERMFERFDELHKQGHTDDDVINYLRRQGYTDYVDSYAEWAEIDLRTDDNTTTNPVVPDPMGSASYAGLAEHLKSMDLKGGVLDADLHALQEALPPGTPVAYLTGLPGTGKIRAFTTSAVFVSAGVPVVSLSNGTKAAALSHIEIDK